MQSYCNLTQIQPRISWLLSKCANHYTIQYNNREMGNPLAGRLSTGIRIQLRVLPNHSLTQAEIWAHNLLSHSQTPKPDPPRWLKSTERLHCYASVVKALCCRWAGRVITYQIYDCLSETLQLSRLRPTQSNRCVKASQSFDARFIFTVVYCVFQ